MSLERREVIEKLVDEGIGRVKNAFSGDAAIFAKDMRMEEIKRDLDTDSTSKKLEAMKYLIAQ
eukprot:gene10253-3172_t